MALLAHFAALGCFDAAFVLALLARFDIDFDVLGRQMAHLKQKLMQEGVPPDTEAKMIAKCGLRGDSPARNARKKLQVPLKRKAS